MLNYRQYGCEYRNIRSHVSFTSFPNALTARSSQGYLALMKATIGDAIGLNGGSDEIDLLNRRIESLNKRMLAMVNETIQNGGDIESNEVDFKDISEEIEQLKRRIESIRVSQIGDETLAERLAQIQETIDQREKNKGTYDDAIVRQMVECIQVHKDGKLTIIFGGGYEVEEHL